MLAAVDEADYADRCRAVGDALVAGYRPYLQRVLAQRRLDAGAFEGPLQAGARMLAASLAAWSALPAHRQRATPMELFREALAPPTQALLAVGVAPAARDQPSLRTVPGDVFDLAPASVQDLGEDAWRAMVAWGIARAEAVAGVVPAPPGVPAGRRVALVGIDLMDRSKVAAAAEAAGFELAVWRNPGSVAAGLGSSPPAVALVDVTHPTALEIIAALAGAGVRVVAYGPHVDTAALDAASRAGATEVLPRSRFFARLTELLSSPA
ncbi:MAG: hypothetical protein M3349_03700 [Actinomycetota bacterium]|nr:hypothetical protein [Actinomycetota bacterium]